MPKTYRATHKIITPEFTLHFPSVFSPQVNQAGEDMGYSITMIFDNEKDTEPLHKLVEEAIDLMWPKDQPKVIKLPFREGTMLSNKNPVGVDLDKYPEYEGKWIVKASNRRIPPGVFDAATHVQIDKAQSSALYPGLICRAEVAALAYDNESTGVKFTIENLLRVRDAAPLLRKGFKSIDGFAEFIPEKAGEDSLEDM